MIVIRHICVLLFSVMLSGCFYFNRDQYADIISKPSEEWDFRECLTVITTPVGHNLLDYRTNIKVAVTPYYPSVVYALQRNAQRIMHWSEEEYRFNVDQLMRECNGLYVDWSRNRLVDSRGNFYKDFTQIDSLMFILTINNTAWTSINSNMQLSYNGVSVVVPLISFDQCYIPEIIDIADRIYLKNDYGKLIKPEYVWGRRNNVLTNEETMFVMFYLSRGDYHFLRGSTKFHMLIIGFEKEIKLDFPLEMLK